MKLVKPAIILFLVAAVFGALLGYVKNVTEEPIAKQAVEAKNKALGELIQNAQFEEQTPPTDYPDIKSVDKATTNGELVGYVAVVSTKGYAGEVETMVGISKAEGKVVGIRIVKQTETPGLGANASKPHFYDQFMGKPLVELIVSKLANKEKPEEVQAITASTITTRAITKGVNEVIAWYNATGGAN